MGIEENIEAHLLNVYNWALINGLAFKVRLCTQYIMHINFGPISVVEKQSICPRRHIIQNCVLLNNHIFKYEILFGIL